MLWGPLVTTSDMSTGFPCPPRLDPDVVIHRSPPDGYGALTLRGVFQRAMARWLSTQPGGWQARVGGGWDWQGGEGEAGQPPARVKLSALTAMHILGEGKGRQDGWRGADWEVVGWLWEAAGMGKMDIGGREGVGGGGEVEVVGGRRRGGARVFRPDWPEVFRHLWWQPQLAGEYRAGGQGIRRSGQPSGPPQPLAPAPQVPSEVSPVVAFTDAVTAIRAMPSAGFSQVLSALVHIPDICLLYPSTSFAPRCCPTGLCFCVTKSDPAVGQRLPVKM